jgi:hypothetical protein
MIALYSPVNSPPTQWTTDDWLVLTILFVGFPFVMVFAAAGAMKIWQWLGRLEKWSCRRILKARRLKAEKSLFGRN